MRTMGNRMQTTIVYWGYMEITGKRMETNAIMGLLSPIKKVYSQTSFKGTLD